MDYNTPFYSKPAGIGVMVLLAIIGLYIVTSLITKKWNPAKWFKEDSDSDEEEDTGEDEDTPADTPADTPTNTTNPLGIPEPVINATISLKEENSEGYTFFGRNIEDYDLSDNQNVSITVNITLPDFDLWEEVREISAGVFAGNTGLEIKRNQKAAGQNFINGEPLTFVLDNISAAATLVGSRIILKYKAADATQEPTWTTKDTSITDALFKNVLESPPNSDPLRLDLSDVTIDPNAIDINDIERIIPIRLVDPNGRMGDSKLKVTNNGKMYMYFGWTNYYAVKIRRIAGDEIFCAVYRSGISSYINRCIKIHSPTSITTGTFNVTGNGVPPKEERLFVVRKDTWKPLTPNDLISYTNYSDTSKLSVTNSIPSLFSRLCNSIVHDGGTSSAGICRIVYVDESGSYVRPENNADGERNIIENNGSGQGKIRYICFPSKYDANDRARMKFGDNHNVNTYVRAGVYKKSNGSNVFLSIQKNIKNRPDASYAMKDIGDTFKNAANRSDRASVVYFVSPINSNHESIIIARE